MRGGDLAWLGAMAALLGQGRPRRVYEFRHVEPPEVRRARRLLAPPRERYAGQRSRYLVGAWRPMTAGEIAEHNAGLPARKARTRGGAR